MSQAAPHFLQQIVEHIDDGIIVVDTKMQVIYWNSWIQKHCQQPSRLSHGEQLTSIFPEAEHSHLMIAVQDTLKNGSPLFLSNLFHTPPITLYPPIAAFRSATPEALKIDINTIPIYYDNAKACVIQFRDVTFSSRRETALEHEVLQRAAVEKDLRESEAKYRLLAENISDIIINTDDKLKISYISPSCMKHLGYDDADMLNNTLLSYIHVGDVEAFNSSVSGKASTSNSTSVRHRLRHRDNSYHWYESTIEPYHSDRIHSSGYIFVTRNIEERLLEEEKRANLQLQLERNQRMNAIGQLSGGIAHGFNNMLTSILGYTELSLSLSTPINPELLKKYLDGVKEASLRAKELVIQLQEYAQGSSIQLQPTPISQALDDAIRLITAALSHHIHIVHEIDANLPLVNLNKIQFEQVLLNLCYNAADAMDNNGIINIHVKLKVFDQATCQSCHELFTGSYVAIEIIDRGRGISEDEKGLVFQPFYSSKSKAEASGLGLSVVHGIVHSHGGHMLLDSSSSATCFTVLLPVQS